jgi:hypothetical protein
MWLRYSGLCGASVRLTPRVRSVNPSSPPRIDALSGATAWVGRREQNSGHFDVTGPSIGRLPTGSISLGQDHKPVHEASLIIC